MKEKERFQEKLIPFSWIDWSEIDSSIHEFYDVIFYDNFGIFKKNDKYPVLTLDTINCVVQITDDNDEVLIQQKYKAIPI